MGRLAKVFVPMPLRYTICDGYSTGNEEIGGPPPNGQECMPPLKVGFLQGVEHSYGRGEASHQW